MFLLLPLICRKLFITNSYNISCKSFQHHFMTPHPTDEFVYHCYLNTHRNLLLSSTHILFNSVMICFARLSVSQIAIIAPVDISYTQFFCFCTTLNSNFLLMPSPLTLYYSFKEVIYYICLFKLPTSIILPLLPMVLNQSLISTMNFQLLASLNSQTYLITDQDPMLTHQHLVV